MTFLAIILNTFAIEIIVSNKIEKINLICV